VELPVVQEQERIDGVKHGDFVLQGPVDAGQKPGSVFRVADPSVASKILMDPPLLLIDGAYEVALSEALVMP
jgi:hypothetical protein